jgi:Clr5 domain
MSETTSRSVVERFKAPQVCDWEIHRPTIARLYLEEGKPLKEVISILHEQHGFQATYDVLLSSRIRIADIEHRPRQYKQRIKAWGLQKNYRPEDVDDLLQHYTKDELQNKVQNGHGSSLMVKGKRLSVSDVKRHLRRIKPLEIPADSRKSPLSSSKSEDFIFASPSTAPNVRSSKREEPTPSPYRTRLSTPPALTTRGAYLDVRSASPSNISTEAFTTDKSSYEHEKEESDTQRKRRRLSKPRLASSLDTRALACPFYKHNPWIYNPQNEDMESAMRYRTCAGPGWESISRLKYVLYLLRELDR